MEFVSQSCHYFFLKKKVYYIKNYGRMEVRLHALLISRPEGDECSALHLYRYIPRVLSIQFTGDFVGFKASQYLVTEGKIYVPAVKRAPFILIAAILFCYLIIGKMVYTVVTQLQCIRFMATVFGFYKTIFSSMLTTGRYIQCVHT